MGLISVTNIADGTVIDANDVNSPINTIVNEINGNLSEANMANTFKQYVLGTVYPVGSIYTSVNPNNPSTTLGFGTWASFGAGRTLVGVDTSQTEFDTVEETGGAKTHTLTTAEMPVHGFSFTIHGSENGTDIAAQGVTGGTTGGSIIGRYGNHQTYAGANSVVNPSWSWGGNAAHNNLQPYVTVYFWKRTA